jgi:copper chaperone CopZ
MTELNVSGMSCGGCVNSVSRIISRTASLDAGQVDVDLESGRATFPEVDADTLKTLLDKLEAAGFASQVETSQGGA